MAETDFGPRSYAGMVFEPVGTHDEIDLAYAAGFLDGEGCFCSYRSKSGWYVAVTCSNANKPSIEWLHKLLGGSMSKTTKKRKELHRPMHIWQVVGLDAVRVCKLLAPYLKQKLPQAILVLSIHQTAKWPKNSNRLTEETIHERIRLSTMLRKEKHVSWN